MAITAVFTPAGTARISLCKARLTINPAPPLPPPRPSPPFFFFHQRLRQTGILGVEGDAMAKPPSRWRKPYKMWNHDHDKTFDRGGVIRRVVYFLSGQMPVISAAWGRFGISGALRGVYGEGLLCWLCLRELPLSWFCVWVQHASIAGRSSVGAGFDAIIVAN